MEFNNPLPPNYQQQVLKQAALGAMQRDVDQIKMQNSLTPEEQADFDSVIQGYNIPEVQLPTFNQ